MSYQYSCSSRATIRCQVNVAGRPKAKRCTACGGSWDYPYDDHRDPRWVGYQCRNCGNCGNVQGLTRRTILRRVADKLAEY